MTNTDPVAVATEPRPEPRWAHEVAPAPNGFDYFDPNRDTTSLPTELATYHIARAYGFYIGSANGDWPHGLSMMLAEYQLATIWHVIACTGALDGAALATELVTDLDSPQVIGPNIAELLDWANVDPAEIKPYGPDA